MMTLLSHISSNKPEDYLALSNANMENNNNSYTFITTDAIDFEVFYYAMLNNYMESLFLGDPLGPNKPSGPHVMKLYDRNNRTIHHVSFI